MRPGIAKKKKKKGNSACWNIEVLSDLLDTNLAGYKKIWQVDLAYGVYQLQMISEAVTHNYIGDSTPVLIGDCTEIWELLIISSLF